MGILDFLQQPDAQLGIGLLAAGGPTTDPNQTGFGQRLAGAMNHVTANQQIAMRAKLMQSQLEENASQNALRNAQIAQAQQKQAGLESLFGGAAGTPVAGGAPGMQLKGMPVETVAKLKTMYGIDLMDQWKAANVPTQFTAGSYAYTPGQRAEYLPDPTKGVGFNGQQITMLPGAENISTLAGMSAGATSGAQANFKPIKVFNPATQREEFTTEGAVVGGGNARTGNPLIDAVIQTESNGNPNAVSPKGAKGLMQVMPGTNTSPGFGVAPARDGSEAERTRVGQEYLGKMKERYGGNDTLAAIAYNWGPGNTDMWIKSGGDYSKLPTETKNYVSAVMTRTAVNGLGGGQSSASGNYAAGPSAAESAQAKATEARMVDTAKADVVRATGKTAEDKRAGQVAQISGLAAQLLDQGPTASGVGSLVDSAANFVGQPLKGGTKAQQLEALSGWLVSNVPRMEGPQSNADVLNYQTMAGRVGDRTLPVEARKAALGTLMELQKKYSEVGSEAAAPTAEKPAGKPPVPMKGMVQDGYKFKGGNPADQASWEKM